MEAFIKTQERRIHRSEARLICSILRGRRSLAWLAVRIQPEDFQDYRHQLIWAAMQALHRRGEPVCTVSVQVELANQALADDAGGTRYLRRLERMSPARKR